MGRGEHKVFTAVVKEIPQDFTILGQSGSEFSSSIPYPGNFAELTKLLDYIKKPWIKETLKEIKNIMKNQTFLVEYPEKGEPVTPCMDVLKAKIKYDGSLDNLKFIFMVKRDLQNEIIVGDTWSPTVSMRDLKYFLENAVNHKVRLHQLDFIAALFQAKVKKMCC